MDCGEEVSTWLSEFLGKPCRLIRQRPEFLRDMKFGPEKGQIKHLFLFVLNPVFSIL